MCTASLGQRRGGQGWGFGVNFFNILSFLTIQPVLVLSVYQDIICFLLFPKLTLPTGPIVDVQRRTKSTIRAIEKKTVEQRVQK